MPIDAERLVNWPFEDIVQAYTERDTMLYALGIGLGADPMDPRQLRFVYERNLTAFPTMPVVLCHPGAWTSDPRTGIVRGKQVHGEQGIILHRPLPKAGTVRGRTRITGVVDKGVGRGALLYTERRIVDHESDEPLATLTSTSFARDNGGFGGPTGPVNQPHPIPTAAPEFIAEFPTFPHSALLYRLNADYNPLHSDPEVAKAAGFPRPILHGLCTFGIAAHAIIRTCCGYETSLLRSIQARFSAPVFSG